MDLPLSERLRGCDTADLEVWATTIGRANPKIAGSRPGGVHARRRAWARLTRRQPPHARARALPETNPSANGRSPIPLEIAKNPINNCNMFYHNALRKLAILISSVGSGGAVRELFWGILPPGEGLPTTNPPIHQSNNRKNFVMGTPARPHAEIASPAAPC